MNSIKVLISVFVISYFLVGCQFGNSSNDKNIQVEVIPFYKDLNETKADSLISKIEKWKRNYGIFLEAYSLKVIKIGSPTDAEYPIYLKKFLEYEPGKEVYAKCLNVFGDFSSYHSDLNKSFSRYLNFFPNTEIPKVFLQISGFNQSMVVDSGFIGISIDRYLGSDCKFYEWLAFPQYLRAKMVPQKVVPDVMKAIALTDFVYNDSIDDVINNMIYKGKVLWFVKEMNPDMPDSLLFDYSKSQLRWCEKHEAEMWAGMVEAKHLFNTERMVIQKYVGEAPFTYYFGQDSPGEAGVYLGYQIVEAYMLNNKNVSLVDLMNESDGRKILSKSAFRP